MSADRSLPLSPEGSATVGPPAHATLLVADIERFSSRDGADQMRTREAMYGEFRAAFTESVWSSCLHEDRGDGLLVVIPQQIPKSVVLGEFLPRLDAALGRRRRDDPLLRMRIAVHAGDVHFDEHGIGGHAVNRTFRLCDSDPLRKAIGVTRGDLALLVSEAIHEDVVRGGYPGIAPQTFHAVDVRVKETAVRAWLHVPGDADAARRVAAEAPRSPVDDTRDAPPRGGVSLSAGGDLRLGPRNNIAGRDLRIDGETPPRRWWRR
ncbi:adenylate/guanylate cyclase [Streptomyces sp. B1I3]|uniref:adenylate/guanylate cyclase n=1 Tax=Streptomyces sp. B1I3 TaxID=3042264 RepID=UPI00278A1AB6|nr:adenylate/guanylate cyclase [Streptomyces sp. B1I3]MDQ0795054.1 class 3 adenylate cyclase [Streptomyces sp. B1I3]